MIARETNLRQLKKDHGFDCALVFCSVNTDNEFVYRGETYVIDASVEIYAPKHTALGLLYDADKIICVEDNTGKVSFYAQNYEPIDSDLVRKK